VAKSLDTVKSRVLKKIIPSAAEEKETQELFRRISNFIKERYQIEARLMGSSARGTDLARDKDIDIFIFFPPETTRAALEAKALAIGKSVFKKFRGKSVVEYAEHPYTKGTIGKFRVEIVPAYHVKDASQKISAVDRTPFHNDYVTKKLSAEQKNEVRLLKKFFEGIGCYGSDLKTQGFSGYLCELLIIRYGSFENVLRSMQNWTFQEFVDIEAHHDPAEHARLKKAFEGQPLIFIDPVDKDRNVAAVVSKEKLARAIFMARLFLANPSESFFFPPKRAPKKKELLKDLKGRNTSVVAITFKKPRVVDDILYPQLRRLKRAAIKALAEEGFGVIDAWEFGDVECGLAFELLSSTLPSNKIVLGPPIFSPASHQDAFFKKYKKVWFIEDRLVAEVERPFKTFKAFLADWLDGTAEQLQLRGIPPELARSISKSFELHEDVKHLRSEEFWRGLEKNSLK